MAEIIRRGKRTIEVRKGTGGHGDDQPKTMITIGGVHQSGSGEVTIVLTELERLALINLLSSE